MSLTRSKPLKRPTETSSYIPTWDIGFSRKDILMNAAMFLSIYILLWLIYFKIPRK
nr:MAG TPA: hypothetical protein [Caudoviricetes sp.]